MADKKKATTKKAAAPKKKYCLHIVWTEGDEIVFDELYEEAGTFATKEKAEAFMKENPGLPQLRLREC
jgi:hypothetical protein